MSNTSSIPATGPNHALFEKLRTGESVVAGVLSGTSADGIDVALFQPKPGEGGAMGWHVIALETLAFEECLAGEIRRVLDGGALSLEQIGILHRDLGLAFGGAVRRVAERNGQRVDLVGSHGQTVWHHDGQTAAGAASLQLGDGDFLAEASGAAVVSDFRQRDIAAGGEGAPIGHLIDPWLFPDLPLPGAILNLGGFGNLTLLDEGGVRASFDTGPAGALLDGLARECLGKEMDRDGLHAAKGEVDPELYAAWMADLEPFLRATPPRSTGRDTYGAAWVKTLVSGADGRAADALLATGVHVVAATVARSLSDMAGTMRPRELVVAGGGARNPELLRALALATQLPVRESAHHGVDGDAREALIFGLLAVAHVLGIALPLSNPRTNTPTGAKCGRLLGKMSPAPPVDRNP